jgi:hypothetical protein
MKVSMYLSQAVRLIAEAPTPLIAGFLDSTQNVPRDEAEGNRITVRQSHDALAMADQLAEAAAIESRITTFPPMD